MRKNLIGIDVGGTTIKIAFLTWDGEWIDKWEIPTRIENDGVNILPDIKKSIDEHLENMGLQIHDFHAAGVGVPGPVQINVGYLPVAVNLGGFGGFNVNDELSKLLGLPVITDNDANVAAIGEMWLGSGAGAQNMAFVTLGTGVGGGLITDGRIISGFAGAGGEIGHMPFIAEEEEMYFSCNCGASGCLETVCSATGIVRMANHYLNKYPEKTTMLKKESLTSKAVFDAAKNGDEIGQLVFEKFSYYFARGLKLLAVITNPEVYVIGGGVSKAGSFLIDGLVKEFDKNIFPNAVKNTEVTLAKLGNDAGVIGSAKNARGIVTDA